MKVFFQSFVCTSSLKTNDLHESERRFAESYPLIRWATWQEDMNEHWDGEFLIGGEVKRVDIKSQKSIKRGDDPSQTHTWIELVNVNNKPGWIFGKADIIAFEYNNDWVLCDRMRLLHQTMKSLSLDFGKKEGQLYRRYQRKDVIVLVPLTVILNSQYEVET